jgi:hypothetical protein
MAIRKFRPQSPDPSINKIKGDTEFARLGHLNRLIDDISNTNIVGPAGPQGVQGPIGPQGVPGPVGPAGLNWQGSWVSGDPYVADDAVGYGGASYFCILATSGTTTPDLDTTHWALLASQGAIGPAGAPGAQGATGAQGPQGPAGGGSYKVYTAIVDVFTSTATVLENTLGVALTVTNPLNGVIRLTAPSATFLSSKTFIVNSNAIDVSNDAYFIVGKRANGPFGDTRIDYSIRKYDNTQAATPNIGGGIFVEIRVYP